MNIKQTRIIVGTLLIFAGLAIIGLIFLKPSKIDIWYWLVVIVIFILMSYYARQLKKYQITQEAGHKLEREMKIGIKRGTVIGAIVSGLIILFLIIYFIIQLNK